MSTAVSGDLLLPVWSGNTVHGESLFFIKNGDAEPPADSLLFTPTRILSVKSPSGKITYEEGRDYVFASGRTLTLPPGSRIPFKTVEQMYPPPGSPNSIAACRDGKHDLFFGDGFAFHELQTLITYAHNDRWFGPVPKCQIDSLPLTAARLRRRDPLRLVLFGDSITAGGNASGVTGVEPFLPPYGLLVAQSLRRAYRATVTHSNYAVGGTASDWGVKYIDRVIDDDPDLVVLAFGMNDASLGATPARFAANIEAQMDAVRAAKPSVEFILVATMTANPDWTCSASELYPRYRDALAPLCRPGVILADVTAVWQALLQCKSFASLTGNGVNHPNDFGHRVYAQVILAALLPQGVETFR